MSPSQPLTVVELFQSQSCNSCPPTNANLLDLVSSPTNSSMLLLTYHVTYWNHLSWTDTFSQSMFDVRQREYVRHMRLRSAFTPQVVVNGRSSGVGSSKGDLAQIMREGGTGKTMSVQVDVLPCEGGADREVVVSVRAGRGEAQQLEVILIAYNTSRVDVPIQRGENRGRVLPHMNVVKGMKKLGTLRPGVDGEAVFAVTRPMEVGMEAVILVQQGEGGPLVGAARIYCGR